MLNFSRQDLIFGLLCTWAVGMGRYWDDPSAKLLQLLGLGSLGYVLALSALLWLILWPLRTQGASYFRILCFVSMTSPPALFYAIPVEKFFSIDTSAWINAYFLMAVAFWRLLLLVFFMNRFAGLGPVGSLSAAMLPITMIIAILSVRGSQHVVFNLMGGLRGVTGPFDLTVYWIGQLSTLALFPVSLIYICLIVDGILRRRRERKASESASHLPPPPTSPSP